MFAYHLVYDTRAFDPPNLRVLVAYKNIYGSRFGNRQTPPTVLNGAGQIVIPGGHIEETDAVAAGQIEFFQETGIDLSRTDVRDYMKCTARPWSRALNAQKSAYCVYQEADDAEFVMAACNMNIRGRVPHDEELHLTKVYDVSFVRKCFGPISGYDLNRGWRGAQYNQLGPRDKALAEDKSQYPGDWYVKAVKLLLSDH